VLFRLELIKNIIYYLLRYAPLGYILPNNLLNTILTDLVLATPNPNPPTFYGENGAIFRITHEKNVSYYLQCRCIWKQ